MRRILVTGATGRLGVATVRRLTERGFEVRAVSRRPREGAVEWVVADLATGEGVAAAVEGVEAVVHLAAAPYKGRYTDRVELDGTRALVDAAAKAGVRHLLYVSIVGVEAVPWGYFMTKLKGSGSWPRAACRTRSCGRRSSTSSSTRSSPGCPCCWSTRGSARSRWTCARWRPAWWTGSGRGLRAGSRSSAAPRC
ncbi:SDR family oxidoreductase [Nonomuraea recticatena]|uniref:SDR family oxidoreductase n=1 Tax=Nonomuraea recticatena TaxID=46178 RepID=UPI00361AFE58